MNAGPKLATGGIRLPSGTVISETSADAAADWLTLFMSGTATAAQRQQWQQWRGEHPDHEAAWRHIEAVTGRLKSFPPSAAYAALSAGPPGDGQARTSEGRRQAMRVLLWGGAAAGAAALGSQTQTWRSTVADMRTRTGERRDFTLEDGTQLTLGTASAVSLQFSASERRIRLVAGEILVQTRHGGPDGSPDTRPLRVETREGLVRSLGTRFIVRQQAGQTAVAVLESAVEVSAADAPRHSRTLRAGEQAIFTRDSVGETRPLTDSTTAWLRNQLVADEWTLRDFIAELGRFRPGMLRVEDEVGDLRLSGVFPLDDTDRILATLPKVLPVEVRYLTHFWVTVRKAS